MVELEGQYTPKTVLRLIMALLIKVLNKIPLTRIFFKDRTKFGSVVWKLIKVAARRRAARILVGSRFRINPVFPCLERSPGAPSRCVLPWSPGNGPP